MGGTKCLRLGTCELECMGGVLQNDSCDKNISAGMARHLHRAIFQHATSRYVAATVQPADVDGDAHVPMDT